MRTLRKAVRFLLRLLRKLVDIRRGIMFKEIVVGDVDDNRLQELERIISGCPFSESEFNARRANGNRFFCIAPQRRLISYGWAATPGNHVFLLFDIVLKVPEKSVYIWDCFTDPSERRQGHFNLILGQIPLKIVGTETALVAVDVSNHPSRRAIEDAGYERLFSYGAVRLLGKTRITWGHYRGHFVTLGAILDDLQSLD